jgi:4-hydroxy-tetrahydrodipicolinate synthase
MKELKGVIPAVTTPFNEDSGLNLPAFRELVEAVTGDGVHGILVGGCTGESWSLTDDERVALFSAAAQQVHGRIPIVAGCGATSAREAIVKVRQAETAGCDFAMVQPPWYILPGEDEILEYYRKILAASKLPIVLYNIPRRTGVGLSVKMVERLADDPKVVAIKESSKDFLVLSEMIRRVGDRIAVFAGYANLLGLAALTEGAVGYMDSSTPVLGRRSIEFYECVLRGDLSRARDLQKQMSRLNAGFFGLGTFPAGVKAALELLGRPGGWTREPIKPLDLTQREMLRGVLVKAGLLLPRTQAVA